MLPIKKKQIVEVQANVAAIMNQKVDIRREVEDASDVIIRLEPELRLDNLGDIVSDEVARRKALVIADKAPNITKSPSPKKYLGLDKSAQENFHSKMGDYKGYNRRVSPTYAGSL